MVEEGALKWRGADCCTDYTQGTEDGCIKVHAVVQLNGHFISIDLDRRLRFVAVVVLLWACARGFGSDLFITLIDVSKSIW